MFLERFTICLVVPFKCFNISLLAATSLAATSVVWSLSELLLTSVVGVTR